MAERLIGTGTTNANGVVSVTYTGTGRGKMDIIAKSGRVQSERCSIWDTVYFDDGTNENYFVENNSFSVTPIENGKTLKHILNGGNAYYHLKTSNTQDTPFSTGTCFEMNTVASTMFRWHIRNTQNVYLNIPSGEHTLKLTVSNGEIIFEVDGVAQSPVSFNTSNFKAYFFSNTYDATLTFTDLKAYLI